MLNMFPSCSVILNKYFTLALSDRLLSNSPFCPPKLRLVFVIITFLTKKYKNSIINYASLSIFSIPYFVGVNIPRKRYIDYNARVQIIFICFNLEFENKSFRGMMCVMIT